MNCVPRPSGPGGGSLWETESLVGVEVVRECWVFARSASDGGKTSRWRRGLRTPGLRPRPRPGPGRTRQAIGLAHPPSSMRASPRPSRPSWTARRPKRPRAGAPRSYHSGRRERGTHSRAYQTRHCRGTSRGVHDKRHAQDHPIGRPPAGSDRSGHALGWARPRGVQRLPEGLPVGDVRSPPCGVGQPARGSDCQFKLGHDVQAAEGRFSAISGPISGQNANNR
jgi:hypothetical protein